jgi:pimeloyl-ACP methyl ester carboxylesterase
MTIAHVNGVRLFYEAAGSGRVPLVLVHGSWVSHESWEPVVPLLSASFRVVAYDRRGHGASERPAGQGSVREDVADLAALVERLGLAPAFLVANSFGGAIALRLAAERPDLVHAVAAHEPPLFSLLAGDPAHAALLDELGPRVGAVAQRIAAGDHAGAAEEFCETVALGPGSWAQIPDAIRRTFVQNAPTFLDEVRDPEALAIDPAVLRGIERPVLLSLGDQSPAAFAPVIARLAKELPRAQLVTFPGAGHVPHLTHPGPYAEAVAAFVGGPAAG